MKSKNSRPPVPHNGKKSRSSFTKKLVASSWDDQPDLSDEPELPPFNPGDEEIPERKTSEFESLESFFTRLWNKNQTLSYSSDEEEIYTSSTIWQLRHELVNEISTSQLDFNIERLRTSALRVEIKSVEAFYAFIIDGLTEAEVDMLSFTSRDEFLTRQNQIAVQRVKMVREVLLSHYAQLKAASPVLDIDITTTELVELGDALYYHFGLDRIMKRVKIYHYLARLFNKHAEDDVFKNIAARLPNRENKTSFLSRLIASYLKAANTKK